MLTVNELAQMIDHSILLPAWTDEVLVKGIEVAKQYHVFCVAPKTYQTPRAVELLRGTGIRVACPVSFPQGLNAPEIKQAEAEWALKHGADELDMVLNISEMKSGHLDYVARDIAGVVKIAQKYGAKPVKVILECYLLTDDEKVCASQIAEREGAAWIKTSTQTQPGGATVEDVRLIRATVGPNVQVKASGYITDADKALALYEAGARRFGTGYTAQILEGLKEKRAMLGLEP